MSFVVQLDTPIGLRWHLDGQPLTNGDLIEVYRWDEWHRGKFAAHEDPGFEPSLPLVSLYRSHRLRASSRT